MQSNSYVIHLILVIVVFPGITWTPAQLINHTKDMGDAKLHKRNMGFFYGLSNNKKEKWKIYNCTYALLQCIPIFITLDKHSMTYIL